MRMRLERLLMRLVNTAGLRGVEQLIRSARVPRLEPERDIRGPRLRRWAAVDPDRHAELSVAVSSNPIFKYVSVRWSALPPQPSLTAREKKIKAIQDQFFARYMAAGDRAYATPARTINAADRRILLVGELEADVNNGGFSQYLDNKGRRRAAAALRSLEHIGASKTAAMLREALASSGDEAVLQKLDAKFYRSREDLAVLAMAAARP